MNAPMQNLAISLGVMQRNQLFFFLLSVFSLTSYVSLGLPSRPQNSFREPPGARLCPDSLCREPSLCTYCVLLHVFQGLSQVSPVTYLHLTCLR